MKKTLLALLVSALPAFGQNYPNGGLVSNGVPATGGGGGGVTGITTDVSTAAGVPMNLVAFPPGSPGDGTSASLRASDGVHDDSAAAPGGPVTIHAGDANRAFAIGANPHADGGDLNIELGNPVGSGRYGVLKISDGTNTVLIGLDASNAGTPGLGGMMSMTNGTATATLGPAGFSITDGMNFAIWSSASGQVPALAVTGQAGAGVAFACLDTDGTIYRSATACVP